MSSDDLKAWLLMTGFTFEFSRYFYLRYGFNKLVTVAVLIDESIEVRSFSKTRIFVNASNAKHYIQTVIRNQDDTS